MAAKSNLKTLQSMWKVMTLLSPTSSATDIEKTTQFFSPSAVAYLNGMSAPPAIGHPEIIAAATQLSKVWTMHKLNITNTIESSDGNQIVQTMKNHLKILGKDVEGFDECEVVTFDKDGLIARYELFCDPAPIVKIFEQAGEESRASD